MKIDGNIVLKLNQDVVYDKVKNNRFGLFLAQSWKRLVGPYTPRHDGTMEDTAVVRPFEIEYVQPYSHYMYYGVIYEDPVLHAAGIFSEKTDSWFSRPGVKKVPRQSGKITFDYLRDSNPYATDHWDKAAEKAGQKEKLIREANHYLQGG